VSRHSWFTRFLPCRYLLTIGSVKVSSYFLLLYLGIVIGVFAGATVASGEGIHPRDFSLVTSILLIPAFIGARLAFIVQNLSFFRGDIGRIWRRDEGGAMLYGGLILSVMASMPLLGVWRLPFWQFWDAASITMLTAAIPARIGCMLNGCCVGRSTDGGLGVWLPDIRGSWKRRYPTPLLEALLCLVILLFALALRRNNSSSGTTFLGVVASYGSVRALLELTRETTAPRRTTWVNVGFSMLLVVVSVTMLLLRMRP
jgi:phosphatidylglycerol:prolipoprotein diacylglycerol transferase